jgi:hypothetical protein
VHDSGKRDAAHAPASDTAAELLERAAGFDALCESLESVRPSGEGRVVLVGGRPGWGRPRFCGGSPGTATARRRCSRVAATRCSRRAHPLGPLLAVAEEADGAFEEVITNGAMPHELAAALVRQLSAHIGRRFESCQRYEPATTPSESSKRR